MTVEGKKYCISDMTIYCNLYRVLPIDGNTKGQVWLIVQWNHKDMGTQWQTNV